MRTRQTRFAKPQSENTLATSEHPHTGGHYNNTGAKPLFLNIPLTVEHINIALIVKTQLAHLSGLCRSQAPVNLHSQTGNFGINPLQFSWWKTRQQLDERAERRQPLFARHD